MTSAFVDLSTDPAALRDMLVRLRLAQPGEPMTIEPLSGGVSSNIFRVDLARGPVCVKQALPQLRVAKEWLVPTSRALAEIDWLTTANGIVPGHVPRLLGADRDHAAFVMEFLATRPNWKQELLAGRIDLDAGAAVAGVLGRMHAATARSAEMQHRFANDANFFLLRLDPYLLEAARAHPDLARELVALVVATQATPLALVHGDVSPKNILLGDAGPMLLDAECAVYGDPAFDLAFLLNHMLLKSAHMPEHAAPMHCLYGRVAATYRPAVTWESAADFERRCARLLAGLLLARIDGKSPVEYLGEDARAHVRATARELLRVPAAGLSELLARWIDAARRW